MIIICNQCQNNKNPFPFNPCPIIEAKQRRKKHFKSNYLDNYAKSQEGKNYNDKS